MAYARNRLNFNTGGIVDPYEGLQRALTSIGNIAQTNEANRLQQARIDQAAKKFAYEQERQTAEDIAAGLPGDVKLSKTKRKTGTRLLTPAVEGQLSEKSLGLSENIGNIADERMQLQRQLDALNMPKPESDVYEQVRGNIPASSAANAVLVDASGNRLNPLEAAIARTRSAFGSPIPRIQDTPVPTMSAEDLTAAIAAKDKQIESLTGKISQDYSAGAAPAQYEDVYTTDIKAPTQASVLSNMLRKAEQEKGSPLSTAEKGAIGRRAENVFTRAQDQAYKERLLQAQYKPGQAKETTYDKEVAKLKARQLFGQLDKGNKKDFDFAAELYKNLTSKDENDVKAIDAYLSKNADIISKMSKKDQKAEVERLKALYDRESGYFDLTDWVPFVGGSAFGDIANK